MSASLQPSSASNESPYAYQPLSAEADTRIIELVPAIDASFPLQCRISELSLWSEDLTDYEALSYTWGQPDFSETLSVIQDGQTSVLGITPNLRDALERLRLPDRERRLWVDAVCIDQKDKTDKSKQIPALAQIFKCASRVLVWLGRSPEGQQSLACIKNAVRFQSNHDDEAKAHLPNTEKAIRSLVALPWFGRRWVIQEVVLAADVVMMCGSQDLPFVRLLHMMNGLLRDTKALNPRTLAALGPLVAISKLWKTWVFGSEQDKGLRLIDLLQVFADWDCAVGHDKVFALCSLASDCLIVDKKLAQTPAHKIAVVVDYSRPTVDLYQSITEQMLGLKSAQADNMIWEDLKKQPVFKEIIDAVIERCNDHYRTDLPPWVPDWCLPRRRGCLYNFLGEKPGHGYYHSRGPRNGLCGLSDKMPYAVQQNPLEQRRSGVMGLITSVLEPFPKHPNILEIKDWLHVMRVSFPKYPTGGLDQRPLSGKTLCRYFGIEADRSPSGNDTIGGYPDSAWCYFLMIVVEEMFQARGKGSKRRQKPVHHLRDLYNLSSGKTDIDIDSKSWLHFCSAFKGRRLFFFKVDNDPEYPELIISGVGIGPDHLAVGTCLEVHGVSIGNGMPYHTLAWYSQAGHDPALVGDVWYFTFVSEEKLLSLLRHFP